MNVSGRIAGVKQVLGIGVDRLSYRPSFLGDLILISFFSSFLLPTAFFALVLFSSDEFVGGITFLVLTLLELAVIIITIWSIKKNIDRSLKK